MKIALVSPYDYPFPGGVTEHIAHLEEEFQKRGHEVTIIAPSSSDTSELVGERVIKVGSIVPIPANGSVARISLSLRLSGRVKRLLKEENFDIIHLHEPLLPALPITVLRHSQSVNVGTFHAYSGNNIAYFYGRPILRRFFGKLDGRIAVSPAARDFVQRHFGGDYRLIPNGIDLSRFNPSVPYLPTLKDGKLNLLFVGRLEKRKGFRYLLRAYIKLKREFPALRLIVVGAYTDEMRQRYQAYVNSIRLADVIFAGRVSADDLPRYYRSADIFCAPSTGGESFGIILLEAMACGCPIVASDIIGYRWVLDEGQQGLLVPPKDEEALAAALRRLILDPELRRRMGASGVEKAKAFSWSSIAERVLGYYEDLIAARAQARAERGRPSRFRVLRRSAKFLITSRWRRLRRGAWPLR